MELILAFLKTFGFEPVKTLITLKELPRYFSDLRKLKKQKGNNSDFIFGNKRAILAERNKESGTTSGHYFHQDLLIARKIFTHNPNKHVDIGSRTDGFVAHVAVFREIEVLDIRLQTSKVKNIVFKHADLMKLPEEMIDYCDSLSSLHAIEHFGLGRYGDTIDYFGHIKAIANIHKIIKPGGKFYFSVPIGTQRIEFNAHRVFSVAYLLNLFTDKFGVDDFSYVNDNGDLLESVKLEKEAIDTNFNCNFGCGIFEMTKNKF